MSKKDVGIFGAIAAMVIAMLAFAPSEWRQAAPIFGAIIAAIAAQLVPGVRGLTIAHRRTAIMVGIAMIAASLLIIYNALSSSTVEPEAGSMVAVFLMLTGSLVIALPFMAKGIERDIATLGARKLGAGGKAIQPPAAAFRPDREVKAIVAELIYQRGALIRVTGPWFLLFCTLPMVFVPTDYWRRLADGNAGMAMLILLGLLIVLIAEHVILAVAMIQWSRFVATKREPSLVEISGRTLWGWAWRWLAFAGILQAFNGIEAWLKDHLPTAPMWQITGLEGLIGLAAAVLLSPLGMVLPAVTLDAANKSLAASIPAARGVGRQFYLGAAMIVGPHAVVSWALGLLLDGKDPVALAVNVGVWLVSLFGTAIVGMTYLTRIYMRGIEGATATAEDPRQLASS